MATIRSNKIKYSISENFILSKNYSLGLYFVREQILEQISRQMEPIMC